MAAQTVLVVEHDAVVRELLRRALRRFRVLMAVNVESGLALLEQAEGPVDLVVVDVLPGRDGDEIAAEIRRRDRSLPVLLISSGVNLPFETPELDKPFSLAELERRIGEVLPPPGQATVSRGEGRKGSPR